jgi:hypothetical protein
MGTVTAQGPDQNHHSDHLHLTTAFFSNMSLYVQVWNYYLAQNQQHNNSEVQVRSRLSITYGIHHGTKPGFVALTYIQLDHVLRVLALHSASRARRLRTRVFVKGSTIRWLSNKRTLVRCKELTVDRVGLVISIEVL